MKLPLGAISITGPSGSVDPTKFERLPQACLDHVVETLVSTSDVRADTQRVLSYLQEKGARVFFRQDLTKILLGMGFPKDEVSYNAGYYAILDICHELADKAERRSWWIFKRTHPTTMEWFESQIRDKNLDARCARLLQRTHPTEDLDELHSHVCFWFAKWGAKGHCDDFLKAGKAPTISILLHWLEHKWGHHQYRMAKDALHREAGKRTQSEIRHRRILGADDYQSPGSEKSDPDAPEIALQSFEEGEAPKIDFVDSGVPLSEMFDEEELSFARDVIRVTRTRAADRYSRFLDYLFKGLSKEEVAVKEECSELRVSHLYQRIRDDLRSAPDLIEVALKVLALVSDEPWSTKEEILEEVREPDKDIGRAIDLLRLRGFLDEGSGEAFAPTEAGRNAFEARSLI